MSSKLSKRTVRQKKRAAKQNKSILLPLNKVLKYIIAWAVVIGMGYQFLSSSADAFKSEPADEALIETEEETENAEVAVETVTEATSETNFNDLTSLTYDGTEIVYVNGNVPQFLDSEIKTAKTDAESVTNYAVDSLNRPSGATFVVSSNTLTTEERGDISDIYPPGWNQEKYDASLVDGGYIYNRCHLIAHCLGGIDDASNLITGTRYLNIEGMWQMEETVKYAAEDHPEVKILYRVTPVYEGNESVCRGVLMEAYSLDDDGETLSFCVYCHNVQPYINIDYETGETTLATE